MSENKLHWIKPQLIVLARGTPEESVLLVCKQIDVVTTGPINENQDGCNSLDTGVCGACQARPGGGS